MSDPYLGEIRSVGFNFPPVGWTLCNGRVLNISDYPNLFALIGTTYGGDGKTNFAVPDLRSRAVIHQGSDDQGNQYNFAQTIGSETVTLNTSQVGIHTHPLLGDNGPADQADPSGAYPAALAGSTKFYSTDSSGSVTPLAPNSTTSAGGGGPHNNLMPFQCVNYIIALEGIYPPHDG